MRSRFRAFILGPLVIILCSFAAGFLGGGYVSAAGTDDPIRQSLKSFTRIYDAVEQNFADPVKPDKAIYNGAIPGMLNTLDPHSHFLDPKEYNKNREEMSERYYGTGMYIGERKQKIVVQWPFRGSPAFKAGLRPGDIITIVNDKKIDGMHTPEVADLLKGPRGSHVQLVIEREGAGKPITVNLLRDEIPRPSVPHALFLRPGLAYVEITGFNENTAKELDDNLKQLGETKIKGLVLDLRNNPGGLVNQSVDVAQHFLRKGELVVSQRGRVSANKNYAARADGTGKDYPIVVLVNRLSASASEIVSGALQDHDRGWILGEPTFGKGLMQSVFQLSGNTALALTTAHFYTPSGRLIQRDYSNISFLNYYTRNNLDQKNAADVKMTDSGRTVYGGGGITPDERFVCTTAIPPFCTVPDKPNKFQIEIFRTSSLFNFAPKYFAGRAGAWLPKGWEPDEKVVDQFHDFLLQNKADFTEAEFTANHDWLKRELKRELYITGFSFEDSQRVAIEQDPEIQKGIDSMPKAMALLTNSRKLLVQRR